MYVCICKSVTDSQIKDAVDTGVASFEAVQKVLSVGTGCGTCRCDVEKIVESHLEQRLNSMPNSGSVIHELKLGH